MLRAWAINKSCFKTGRRRSKPACKFALFCYSALRTGQFFKKARIFARFVRNFLDAHICCAYKTFCPLIAGVSLDGREGLVESTLMLSTSVEIDKCRRYQMPDYVEPYQPFSWTLTLCDPWAVVVEEVFLLVFGDPAGPPCWKFFLAKACCARGVLL
jgi:hypothetical protein